MENLLRKLQGQRTFGQNDPLWRLESDFSRWKDKDRVPTFHFRKMTVQEACKFVMRMGNALSFAQEGIDGILKNNPTLI